MYGAGDIETWQAGRLGRKQTLLHLSRSVDGRPIRCGDLLLGNVLSITDEVGRFTARIPDTRDGQTLQILETIFSPVPDFSFPVSFGANGLPHRTVEMFIVSS